MMTFVVAPSRVASSVRVSWGGRSAKLNDAAPLACRWLISSATGRLTRTMWNDAAQGQDHDVLVDDLGGNVGVVCLPRFARLAGTETVALTNTSTS